MKNDDVHRIGNTDAGARATSGDERIAEPKSDASMIIFHDPDKEYGFLSNWYLSYLKVGDVTFSSVEQYLMYRKAEVFHDTENMKRILSTEDPETIKKYGRSVKPFDSLIWDAYRPIVLYQGVRAKFHDNPTLAEKLVATGEAILVEGSASDLIFANGLRRDDPNRYDLKKWKGKSILGFTLMEVRKWLG